MIDVSDLLYQICEDDRVYDDDCELMESGILDSLAFIELFSELEDNGIVIHPTQINKSLLKTPKTIKELIAQFDKK